VVELTGGGTDIVYAAASHQLGAGEGIEYLRAFAATGLVLTGNEFDNQIICGTGNDRLNGRDGDDTITTSRARAIIYGGNGNGSIGLDGSSTSTGRVNGGDGSARVRSADLSQFVVSPVETLDAYYGFISVSVAQIASFDVYGADLATPDTQISISLRGAGGTLDFTNGISGQNSGEIRDAGLTSRISITGFVNDDRLFGSDFNDAPRGGNGDDVLLAGSGCDTLAGGLGDDRERRDQHRPAQRWCRQRHVRLRLTVRRQLQSRRDRGFSLRHRHHRGRSDQLVRLPDRLTAAAA
jgi:Ca2+-binding RTX toxin-like protein